MTRDLSVGTEILTAVIMKSPIFYDTMPCNSLKVSRCFGAIYRHHLQGPILVLPSTQQITKYFIHTFIMLIVLLFVLKYNFTTCFGFSRSHH
jgi:hypothetical protein